MTNEISFATQPPSRSDEVTNDAMNEGLINGGLVLACSQGFLYFGMQNENFRKVRFWFGACTLTEDDQRSNSPCSIFVILC